ncbi:P-loop containing nucleoside triphosphate hydrolase protein, partial [Mycena latifolia]
MSASNPPIAPGYRPSHRGSGSPFRPLQPPLSSNADWLSALIFNAKAINAGVEPLPFPYVKGVFGTVVFLLETVEKVQKNRDSLKELCADTVDIITVVQDQISHHGDTAALKFKSQCEELEGFLQDVVKSINEHQTKPRGFSSRLKEVVRASSTSEDICRFQDRIKQVRSNFMLMATMDTNFQVQKVLTVISPAEPVPEVHQYANTCPPPTRIFHGRQGILDNMHSYFTQDLGKQHIFLLHGIGGAGKTQIALKFIEESAPQFADIFLIDMSTVGTIDTGLKNIAMMKSVGDSSQAALQWLKSKKAEWLLFFDNADDPKIDLNKYFPQCSHGNIIITSRNPGLCVYTSAHCAVTNMEESDSVDLLLRSAAHNPTDHNKETAAQIVQTLCYLPLAIIQAGAFISKSGNLDSYLALYADNKARLLTEKPSQSHDSYAWTVYTTWKISFDQLSDQAKTFLKLCSFLHYQGISENIFKNATK